MTFLIIDCKNTGVFSSIKTSTFHFTVSIFNMSLKGDDIQQN